MIAAGLVEVFLGVDAEQKSLEDIATPLTEAGEGGGSEAPPTVVARATGSHPLPRTRVGRVGWAPFPQASDYPRDNPFLRSEVDRIVGALEREGVLSYRADLG